MSKFTKRIRGRVTHTVNTYKKNFQKDFKHWKIMVNKKLNHFVTWAKGAGRLTMILIGLVPVGLIVLNISFYLIAIGQTVGSSPHFYCDAKASDEVKSTEQYQQYCKGFGSVGGNNSSIAEAAISLATTDETVGGRKINWSSNGFGDVEAYATNSNYTVGTFLDKVPKIVQTAQELKSDGKRNTVTWSLPFYASCDLTTSMAVLWSGADDNFPMTLGGFELFSGGKGSITGYLVNGGGDGKWKQVPKGEKILPGDIAMGNNHGGYQHVWMYVATWENGTWTDNSLVQKKYPGSTANTYQGSYLDYYASLSDIGNPWSFADVVYRYVGTPDEQSPFRSIK